VCSSDLGRDLGGPGDGSRGRDLGDLGTDLEIFNSRGGEPKPGTWAWDLGPGDGSRNLQFAYRSNHPSLCCAAVIIAFSGVARETEAPPCPRAVPEMKNSRSVPTIHPPPSTRNEEFEIRPHHPRPTRNEEFEIRPHHPVPTIHVPRSVPTIHVPTIQVPVTEGYRDSSRPHHPVPTIPPSRN